MINKLSGNRCTQQFTRTLCPQPQRFFYFLQKMKNKDFLYYGFQFLLFGLEKHFCTSKELLPVVFYLLGPICLPQKLHKMLSPQKMKTPGNS